ncbi:hypothetical protein BURCENK562V_C3849 [Burkholderia cenocepacia K56-2Valvano]|nr:hypothetical protein BURCENK562V_C3849 [Burkholderia cenocepacia K56-2Valvano]
MNGGRCAAREASLTSRARIGHHRPTHHATITLSTTTRTTAFGGPVRRVRARS